MAKTTVVLGDWNDTTPEAPEGYDNIHFQVDRETTPPSFSGNVKKALYIDGSRAMDGKLGPKVVSIAYAASLNIPANQGNHFRTTLEGDPTIYITGAAYDGQLIRVEIKQDSVGGRIPTFDATAIKRPSNIQEPTFSTIAGATDIFQFLYSADSTKWTMTGYLLNAFAVEE